MSHANYKDNKDKIKSLDDNQIFDLWYKTGCFSRTSGHGKHKDEGFTVVIPPPNITGVLHMGHALNDSIQDTIIRRARMQGYKTRWILGTDHAGIATQTKVDKHLQSQGINRREIGREAFIEQCQKWRREYGTTIVNQIKNIGCSCDYDDENFTMSESFSKAVQKVFVDWFHRGLIYRGKRIVNWCPHCTTAIADDEAEYEPEAGKLWYLKYPLKTPVDGVEYLVIATTRPETMLGDSGIAISPKDKRYKKLIGKSVILPLVNREIPIFEDFYVDAEFGTGCVKVTPAHDPNDYAMGIRHNLEWINIMDETAHIVDGYGKYSKMSTLEAREAIVDDFDKLGLLDHVEDLNHSVMHCYRCHTTLEPWLSEQWFVDVKALKKEAKRVVENQTIKFYPQRWSQVYLDWLDNLKDWCISRQLWWGHRIPVYYCKCGWLDASTEKIETCPKCGEPVVQDEDVLDTWFSSQLWPFGVMGWSSDPDNAELKNYYPTQVLSTARDIMGLWVARMVMSSLDVLGEIPFEHVLIHPTVMGSDGKPMSKSRGNGVDPLELIRKYGADAMRFGLLSQVTGTQAIRFDEGKIENSRNFSNKIKNATKFILKNLSSFVDSNPNHQIKGSPNTKNIVDKWILSRLNCLVKNVDEAYKNYNFSEVTKYLYEFFWNEFCDWYIEFSKSRLQGQNKEDVLICLNNLVFILDCSLKLLHPIMPFITERLFSELPSSRDYLFISEWVDKDKLAKYNDKNAEESIKVICNVIGAVRSIKARYGISPKTQVEVHIKTKDDHVTEIISNSQELISSLVNIKSLEVSSDTIKPEYSVSYCDSLVEVYVVLKGFIDFDKEKLNIQKQIVKIKKDYLKFEKKLKNPGFLKKAKPEIIEKDKLKFKDLSDTLDKLNKQFSDFQ